MFRRLLLLTLLCARGALAFDTAEHAVYERRALQALSAGPRGDELDSLQDALRDLLGRPICGREESNAHCIDIPELTALAGDYSSTPDNLLFRFFEPTARAQQLKGWLVKPTEAFKAFVTTRSSELKKGRGIGEMVRTRPLGLKPALTTTAAR
ncbi:MAG TPA: hypothetical protein VH083_13710 [Myxococcales bacterium]|jgi:hypothetical protein|nr:hypothetical protein [Myxococcales bacterium]